MYIRRKDLVDDMIVRGVKEINMASGAVYLLRVHPWQRFASLSLARTPTKPLYYSLFPRSNGSPLSTRRGARTSARTRVYQETNELARARAYDLWVSINVTTALAAPTHTKFTFHVLQTTVQLAYSPT